jgi:polysaccharide export outer membrane protein
MTSLFRAGLVAVCVLASAVSVAGQLPPEMNAGGSVRSREDLQELLQYYENALQSPVYSDEVKSSLGAEAARIRARLRDGDFKLGDRIVLQVEGEPGLPDTIPVEVGPKITLPLFGDIPLDGVLRSEVQDHITQALSSYLRNPVVRAEGLMRLSVQGAVNQPGFYVVPASTLLSEALMVAGGPLQEADLADLRVERGGTLLFERTELQEALREGLSLDQLNMQAGDQVVVPQTSGGFGGNLLVLLGVLSTVVIIVTNVSN